MSFRTSASWPHAAVARDGNLVAIDLARLILERRSPTGEDFSGFNSFGYMLLLEVDDGSTLREAVLPFFLLPGAYRPPS